MSRKHIGTIIDRSYFDTYHVIKGDNIYQKRICPHCFEEVEEGFEQINKSGRSSGFAGNLPHICEEFKILNKRGDYLITSEMLKNKTLEWGQFMFVKPRGY